MIGGVILVLSLVPLAVGLGWGVVTYRGNYDRVDLSLGMATLGRMPVRASIHKTKTVKDTIL